MTSSLLGESYDPLGAHLEDPHPFYERARRTEPVFFSPRMDAWVVTRFDDVDTVLKDPRTFSSVNSIRVSTEMSPATLAALMDGYPLMPDHVTSDGDTHRRMRAPYARRLTLATAKAFESGIRTRAGTLVDSFVADGRADLFRQYASPLPVATVAELFGQARIALEVLIERLPDLRPAPEHPVRLRESINVHGLRALELRWDPSSTNADCSRSAGVAG